MNESLTPETTALLGAILHRYGILNEYTAPEEWVTLCRKLESERNESMRELKHLVDFLDAHFERGGTVAGIGTTNKARSILSNPEKTSEL